MLNDRVEQRTLLTLVGDECVAADDFGLLQHAEELRYQHRQCRHCDAQQGHEVAGPAQYRVAQRIQKPPGRQEGDNHHPSGEVHAEHPDQRQYRQRDALTVSECGGDQRERRDRDTESRHIGHRCGVELHIGNRRERCRQCGGSGGRTRGPPPGGPVDQQLPGEQPGAEREQPDSCGQGTQRVGGCRGGAGDLCQHGAQRVEGRWIVERGVGFDVAQFAHVGGGGLAGIEDPPNGVGVPHGVPVAGNRLPVRHPPPGGESDCDHTEEHAGGCGALRQIRT